MAEDQVNLSNIPIYALNMSCRTKLSLLLNTKTLTDKDGYNRDFRGLAELLGFEHDHILSFEREHDPMSKILKNWENQPDSTIEILVSHLEFLERHDVVDQIKPLAERNAREYLRRQANNQVLPVQVPEISSLLPQLTPDNPDHLTMADAMGLGPERFDAFICHADEDYEFVKYMTNYLEDRNIHLCIKDRNILPSRFEDDSIIRVIEERCDRMLLIWSPEFNRSPQCDFLSKFATGLTIEQQRNKIIPVVYKQHPMPARLRFLSKVDFARPEWFWNRLIIALKQGDSSFNFALANSNMPQLPRSRPNQQLPPPYQTEEHPAISACQNFDTPPPIIQSPTPSQTSFSTNINSISTYQSNSEITLPSLDTDSLASQASSSFGSQKSIKENKSNKVRKLLGKILKPKKESVEKDLVSAPL